jgi:hypothetical protein
VQRGLRGGARNVRLFGPVRHRSGLQRAGSVAQRQRHRDGHDLLERRTIGGFDHSASRAATPLVEDVEPSVVSARSLRARDLEAHWNGSADRRVELALHECGELGGIQASRRRRDREGGRRCGRRAPDHRTGADAQPAGIGVTAAGSESHRRATRLYLRMKSMPSWRSALLPHPPRRASAPLLASTLALTLSVAASCLPLKDLDTYHSGEATGDRLPGAPSAGDATGDGTSASGAGGELPRTPSSLDPSGVGSTVGGSGNGDAVGPDEAEGELPLSLTDAGRPLSPADAAPASTCASDELAGPNGHCYFFDSRTLSWDAARRACQARGTGWDLVSVRSATDSAFLGDTLTFEAWLGASDAANEGSWVWVVDNQPFWVGSGATGNAVGGAYVNWNSDEPNGLRPDCARLLPRSFGSVNPDAPWADLGCDSLRGAVCELYPDVTSIGARLGG